MVQSPPSTTHVNFRAARLARSSYAAHPQRASISTTRSHVRREDRVEFLRTASPPLPLSLSPPRDFWHRMGDVGYLDEQHRLWFCGRKAHLVETEFGRLFTIPCEAIFNNHPRVFRSALVGVGSKPKQRPVIIIEPETGQFPKSAADQEGFRAELLDLARANPITASIETILFHRALPVDIRHNVKIFREKLGPWAAKKLAIVD